ncbi:hypothetical protein EMIT048CA2_420001 [Pseudomonas chlororaphis]
MSTGEVWEIVSKKLAAPIRRAQAIAVIVSPENCKVAGTRDLLFSQKVA